MGAGLERELIDGVVSLGGEAAPLPCFKIHHLPAGTGAVALEMVFQHPFPAFLQHAERDPKALVGFLRAADRLEEEIDRHAPVEAFQLRGDVGEAAVLGGNFKCGDEPVEGVENRADGVDRLGGRINADNGIAAAMQQAFDRRQQDRRHVVGRVVGLDADAEHAAGPERRAAARQIANPAGSHHQIFVAHQLGNSRRHLGQQGPLEPPNRIWRGGVGKEVIAQFPHRPGGDLREGGRVVVVEQHAADGVVIGRQQRRVEKGLQRDISQRRFCRGPFAMAGRGDPRQSVPRFFLVCFGQQIAEIGKRIPLPAKRGGISHGRLGAGGGKTTRLAERTSFEFSGPWPACSKKSYDKLSTSNPLR